MVRIALALTLTVAFMSVRASTLPLNVDFANAFKVTCSKMVTKEAKFSCLSEHAYRFQRIKNALSDGGVSDSVAFCRHFVESKSALTLTDMSICIEDHITASNSAYPIAHTVKYQIDSIRSEWAAHCAKSNRYDINKCLTKKSSFFQAFTADYSAKKSQTPHYDDCLQLLNKIQPWDFESVVRCTRM